MKLRGILVTAEWDGDTLIAWGNDGQSHRKFAGKDRAGEGTVVIAKQQVARAWLKPSGRMRHGELGVRTNEGRTYPILFRHRQRETFARVARDLGADA